MYFFFCIQIFVLANVCARVSSFISWILMEGIPDLINQKFLLYLA